GKRQVACRIGGNILQLQGEGNGNVIEGGGVAGGGGAVSHDVGNDGIGRTPRRVGGFIRQRQVAGTAGVGVYLVGAGRPVVTPNQIGACRGVAPEQQSEGDARARGHRVLLVHGSFRGLRGAK